MGGFIQNIEDKLIGLKEGVSPTIDDWFLMSSPMPIVSILIIYLFYVLKIGPKLMEKRKPFALTNILIAYNAYQVIFSLWFCVYTLEVHKHLNIFSATDCKSPKTKDPKFLLALWYGAWWYFFSKVIELLDTVFFVLRKKTNQITFLHVYHHAFTCFSSWCYLKYLPGEQGIVIGFLNSLTHVMMYSYYLIAALGPKYQKYLWWKKYMTWIQFTQFGLMLTYLTYSLIVNCDQPKSLTVFFATNCLIYVYLFGQFYRNSYIKKQDIRNLNQLNGKHQLNGDLGVNKLKPVIENETYVKKEL